MSFQAKPALTDAGAVLISRCIAGTAEIYFTAFGAGSGQMTSETPPQAMIAQVLRFPITDVDDLTAQQITISGAFNSTDAPTDFTWRELGVYASDTALTETFTGDGTTTVFTLTIADKPEALIGVKVNGTAVTAYEYNKTAGTVTFTTAPAASATISVKYPDYTEEILYAYANDGNNGGFIRHGATEIVTEQAVDVIIAIGTATDVYVTIGASSTYATKADLNAVTTDLNAHKNDGSNPHGVTAAQLGLGNVSAPTYTVPDTLSPMSSGELLSAAFGKISRAVTSLISHLNNTANPHSVTYSQVGAAAAAHQHNAADIIGGTGGCVTGTYMGTGSATQTISLGFKPKAVYVCPANGMPLVVDSTILGGGQFYFSGFGIANDPTPETTSKALTISQNGFWVRTTSGTQGIFPQLNNQNQRYLYIAFR